MTVKQSLAPATLKNNNDLHKTISNENKPTKMYVYLLKDDSLQSCYEVVMLNTITLAPSHLDRSWQNTQQQNCWHDSPTSTWCSVDPYSCSADQQVLCCYSFIIPIRVNAYPSKADMFLSIFSFCASSLDLHWKTYPLKAQIPLEHHLFLPFLLTYVVSYCSNCIVLSSLPLVL